MWQQGTVGRDEELVQGWLSLPQERLSMLLQLRELSVASGAITSATSFSL